MDDSVRRKRGRPLGFRLSDESKQAISLSKLGHIHSDGTRDKISGSLVRFYKEKYPLSAEMIEYYHKYYGEDAASWISRNRDLIDELPDVITDRAINNFRRRELEFNSCFYKNGSTLDPDKVMDLKRILGMFDLEIAEEAACETICVLIDEMGLIFLLDDIRFLMRD